MSGGVEVFVRAWELHAKYPVVENALIHSVIVTIDSVFLAILINWVVWRKLPRFVPIRGDGPPPPTFVLFPVIFPIVIGLMTLAAFNLCEWLKYDGRHDSAMATPHEVMVFYAVVILFYTTFTIWTLGILARRRKYGGGQK
jgi:hypothetical protein